MVQVHAHAATRRYKAASQSLHQPGKSGEAASAEE